MKMDVTEDQFDVSEAGFLHRPTSYRFVAKPGFPDAGTTTVGKLGAILISGEFYDPREVKWMGEIVWAGQLRRRRVSKRS